MPDPTDSSKPDPDEELFEPTIEEAVLASGGHKKGGMAPLDEESEA